jgi:hypothetical protein
MRITESQLRKAIREALLKEMTIETKVLARSIYNKGKGGWEYDMPGFANWPEFLKKSESEKIAWAKDFIKNGIQEPVMLMVYADGNVKFQDGHHRVLAGSLLNMKIPVEVSFRNFNPDWWPNLQELLNAGYSHDQYNPEGWSLKGKGVPPLEVVMQGPDAANDWIVS